MSAAVRRIELSGRGARKFHAARATLLAGAGFACLLLLFRPNDDAAPTAARSPIAATSTPVQEAVAPPATTLPLEVPSVAAPAGIDGLVLKGVFAGGPGGGAAIMLLPGGAESVVPLGAEFLAGYRLKALGYDYAVLSTGAGDLRLKLGAASGATAVAAAEGDNPAAPRGGSSAAGSDTEQYRRGLQPIRNGSRTDGFAVRSVAALPVLQKAGLRDGDIMVAVNGQAMDSEEKLLELSQEIAGSFTAEFEFIRSGRRMKGTAEINGR